MTDTTTYYDLNIYDPVADIDETFLSFRGKVAGVGIDSNMILIDDALKDIQDQIDVLEVKKEPVYLQVIKHNVDIYLGDSAMFFTVPPDIHTFEISRVEGYTYTESTSGSIIIQLYNVTNSVDILSTPVRIDEGDLNSLISSASSVVNSANKAVSEGDILRIDIDSIGTGVKGLDVSISLEL